MAHESRTFADPDALLQEGRFDELVEVIGLPRFLSLIDSGEVPPQAGNAAIDRFARHSSHGFGAKVASMFQWS